MLIRPENPICKVVARIKVKSSSVLVIFPEKREDFRKLVKSLGFSWNDEAWQKTCTNLNDASAELGYHLIKSGFWIDVPTEEIKDLIVSEEFQAEHRRKIVVRITGIYEGWFVLKWPYGEDLYDKAKRITGSRYDKPNVIIPPESYEELEDFANRHEFYITPAAQRVINEAKSQFESALILNIIEKQKEDLPVPTGLIDNDLADNN